MNQKNIPTQNRASGSDKIAGATIRSPFLTKWDNFMYHYKWHTVTALILIFAVLVCLFQMCGRTSGDISFFQVGQRVLTETQKHQISQTVTDVLMADDDSCQVSYITHYIISTEQLKEMETIDAAYLANTSFENATAFRTELTTCEAYICLFSYDVYQLSKEYLDDSPTGVLYRPLSDFTDKPLKTLPNDDYAIYLQDTPIADLPGFSSLPSDTVLCMRTLGYMTSAMGKDKAAKLYARHELLFERMLNYAPEEEN